MLNLVFNFVDQYVGPLFANIFICGLENHVIPRLAHKLNNWVRYVDDTFALVREGEEKYVQEELNSFSPKHSIYI